MSKINKISNSKHHKIISALFALVVGVIGYTILYQSHAAIPNPPTVYLTPENNVQAPNTQFTIQVRENSGTSEVNAVQFALTYPQNLLDFVGPTDDTGSAFTVVAENTNNNGKIIVARGLTSGVHGVTGDQLITKLTFKTKMGSGTDGLSLVANETSFIDANSYEAISNIKIQGANITVDATSPTVSISGISNGLSVASGSTVPITINSADNTGITGLDINIDGVLKQTINTTSTSYIYQWNTTGLSLANHNFQVSAKDAYGNVGQSPAITVVIADKTPPTVSLSISPTTNPAKGSITLNANASDTGGTGVSKVEFYVGTTLLATDTTSPYQASWDTTKYPDSSYSLTAKAYDGANPANTATSNTINVTVENTDKVAPSAPTNFRSTATNLTSVSLAWNASTDNVGVVGYIVTRNGTTLPTVTGLSLSDVGLNPATTYNYSIVAVDAAGNKSTPTTLTVTTPNRKIGDFNNDGKVDLYDLNKLITNWKTTNELYDLNKNGLVDIIDLSIFLGNYGK